MASRRAPLVETVPAQAKAAGPSEDMTVEQFLELQCEAYIDDLKRHSASLIDCLKNEYADGVKSIKGMMVAATSGLDRQKKLCVTLKAGTGPHLGQKFRLEPSSDDGEDVFKIGRSTGKAFKEKGVSLYKDKEISTSHAKVDIRNGQAFIVDTKSTNGTTINGEDVDPSVPIRLKTGDIIGIGGTELHVTITEQDADEQSGAAVVAEEEEEEFDENFASV